MDTTLTQTYGNLTSGSTGRRRTAKIASGQNLALGTLCRKVISGAIAAGSNTGNGTAGTLTPGIKAKIGVYMLTCIALSGALSAAALVAGGSNVGNGTPGSVTLSTAAKAGTYSLACLGVITGVEHIAVEDLAAGADISAREVWVAPSAAELVEIGILSAGTPAGIDDSNTCVIAIKDDAGNTVVTKTYNTGTAFPTEDYESLGTLDTTHKILTAGEHLTLDVTNGTAANPPAFTVVLKYKASGQAANGGTFAVYDPDGMRLEDLTVGVAYSNSHFGLTIADGSADFAVGDTFTFAVTLNANTATFKVEDPQGTRLADLTVGSAYDNGHFGVTISDGSTDFAVGDTFTVTMSDSGECAIVTGADNVLAGVIAEAVDASSAAAYGCMITDAEEMNQDAIVLPSGHAIATYREALRGIGITLMDPQAR